MNEKKLKPRKLGLLKGKIWISDDFNEENEEINELFYGKDDQIDLNEAREYVTDIIKKAGKIALDYQQKSDLKHKSKGGSDFATEADLEVEKFLKKSLKEKFPQSNFLMEESAPKDYSSFKSVNNLWVIDPIDGTSNFSRGNSYFSISVALVNSGKVSLGIVYSPISGDLFLAQENKPSATLNGKIIKVSKTSSLNEAHIATGFPWDLKKRKDIISWINKMTDDIRQFKINGSAALDICFVAYGELDGYIITGIKPWDMAAAALILEKAGGKSTKPNGQKWDIFEEDMLATNNLIHQKILDLIKEGS